MLAVISPAKTLDFDTPIRTRKHSEPEFGADANRLAAIMREKKPAQLRKLMGISENLATLNHERFRHWAKRPDAEHSRQALFAFMGDVYAGLDAGSLSAADVAFAQKHLRILSGLYGLLRPLDRIQPYRLEMGTALANPRGKDLYHYWGERIARALNEQAAGSRTRWLINLASNEYFNAVDSTALELDVVTPVFKERRGDAYRVLSFFAKRARGMMARHMITARARKPADLLGFDADGYAFNEALSSEREYVFTRDST